MIDALRKFPLHPILFSAFPIVFLAAQNLGELDLGEAVAPLIISVLIGLVAFIVLRRVLRDGTRAGLLVSLVMLAFYLFGHAWNALSGLRLPGVSEPRLLVAWLLATAVAVVVILLVRRDLSGLAMLANIVSIVLVANSSVRIAAYQLSNPDVATQGATPAATPAATPRAVPSPVASPGPAAAGSRDIYYIVIEDYGSRRIIQEQLGRKDNEMLDWLSGHGFHVLPDTRTNYGRSAMAMAAALNMTYLDEVAARAGRDSSSYNPIYQMLRNPSVATYLKARGYSFMQIGSHWWLTAKSDIADVNPKFPQTSDFASFLYGTTVASPVLSRLGIDGPWDERRLVYDSAFWQADQFRQVSRLPGPKFVFLHMFLPHSPYVIDADGNYVSRKVDAARTREARMDAQFRFAERQVIKLVEPLLAVEPDKQPIIVVTTDEGPTDPKVPAANGGQSWGQATTKQLDDHYAIFAAYHLPGSDAQGLYPTMSSVNTFRYLFNEYFDANLPLLPDRYYAHWDVRHPYDLADITERLDEFVGGTP